ncbi:unnamed protein product [Toxocara canis]|uniref:Uncharacterized protein n=1 Tax=Toxocara canis TaxID=6265 RepID=A0A183V7N8_TOXCA|nr:unnamed protein product [Toxocara canis]
MSKVALLRWVTLIQITRNHFACETNTKKFTYFDPSKFGARDSLVRQASIDRMQNEGVRRFSMLKHRKELEQQLHSIPIFSQLNDEGIELIWSSKDDVSMIFTAILAGERTLTDYFQSFTLSLKKLSLLAEL